jgi:hypothetical protein
MFGVARNRERIRLNRGRVFTGTVAMVAHAARSIDRGPAQMS